MFWLVIGYLYNFKIIEILISLTEFILDISSEFKVMHFISSNLLHDFPNGIHVVFFIKKKKKIHVKNMGQPDRTRNPIDPDPF